MRSCGQKQEESVTGSTHLHSGASEAGEANDSLTRTIRIPKGTLQGTPAPPRGTLTLSA